MSTKLNAKELRKLELSETQRRKIVRSLKKNEVYIIVDNVLDTYNIGSIFRLADAVAARKIYLCGGSATPPNHRIKKASINTTEWVEWGYAGNTAELIKSLRFKIKDLRIVAIEQAEKSIPYDKFEYTLPIALVVGNETMGISQEALNLCDAVVELPMFGVNISLNVMVSLGIVLYEVVEKCDLG